MAKKENSGQPDENIFEENETAAENGMTEQTNQAENPHSLQETTQDSAEKQDGHLLSYCELAQKYRVPTWQSAAVLKLLEKEDDAFLSEKEFLAALEKLHGRRMGA